MAPESESASGSAVAAPCGTLPEYAPCTCTVLMLVLALVGRPPGLVVRAVPTPPCPALRPERGSGTAVEVWSAFGGGTWASAVNCIQNNRIKVRNEFYSDIVSRRTARQPTRTYRMQGPRRPSLSSIVQVVSVSQRFVGQPILAAVAFPRGVEPA